MKFDFELDTRRSLSYEGFRDHLKQELIDGNSELVNSYGELNDARMRRWEKTYSPSIELTNLLIQLEPQQWIVLAETWCGDAAQNIAQIAAMTAINENIELKILLRDENLDIMDQFLTNGGRAIPKLIAIDAQKNVLFQWGPRPQAIQDEFYRMKEEGITKAEYTLELQKMYAKDKSKTLEKDFIRLVGDLIVA